jgi:hypothetical protein
MIEELWEVEIAGWIERGLPPDVAKGAKLIEHEPQAKVQSLKRI